MRCMAYCNLYNPDFRCLCMYHIFRFRGKYTLKAIPLFQSEVFVKVGWELAKAEIKLNSSKWTSIYHTVTRKPTPQWNDATERIFPQLYKYKRLWKALPFPIKLKWLNILFLLSSWPHHFMGNCILYSCVIVRLLQKALFVSLQNYYLEALD